MGPPAHRGPHGEGCGFEMTIVLDAEDAQAQIDELASRSAAATDLAHLGSLAARIEPELLRRLRLGILPTAGAEIEADLWHSEIVEARSSSWIVIVPEVAELLRAKCRSRFAEALLEIARDAIRRAHAHASPLVQLEDEIHWDTMRGRWTAIEEKLASVIDALRGEHKLGVAQWAVRSLPHFSTEVRELPAAWVIRLIAEQHLGFPVRLEPGTHRVPPEVWPLLRGAMSTTELFTRLVEDGVELSRDPLIGAHRLTAPLTDPVIVEVAQNRIVVPRGSAAYVRAPHPVHLRTIDGRTHTLSATSAEVVEGVTFRFLLLADLEDPRESRHREPPAHAVFLAGGVASFAQAKQKIDALSGGANDTPVFVVPAESDQTARGIERDFQEFAAFADSYPAPSSKVHGLHGDFSATIEVDGARVGIVGLNLLRAPFHPERLRAVCGPDPMRWARAHHLTILLTRVPTAMFSPEERAALEPCFSLHLHGPYTTTEMEERQADTLVSIPAGTPFVGGEVRIGTQTEVLLRSATSHKTLKIPTRIVVPVREALRPHKWILIAGSSHDLSRKTIETARSLGASLCAAGYGLITGGWRGVDHEVTSGYAAALGGSTDRAYDAIRHYVGAVEPSLAMPGRRLFFSSDREAVAGCVEDAAAVVLIAGFEGTAWIGEEALPSRPLIPIAATGGAARSIADKANVELPWVLRNEQARSSELSAATMQQIVAQLHRQIPDPGPYNPRYRFDSFVAGPSTQLAYSTAKSIAAKPDGSLNPFIIWGGAGRGKTHLLQAMAQELRSRHPDLNVWYVQTETLVTELINSIRNDRMQQFRERFRRTDVLLLDDIQFLAGKERTQEEFLHIIDAFLNGQKQLVFAADRLPEEIPTLDESLRVRLEGGLVAAVQGSDLETKTAILLRKADAKRVELPAAVAIFVAERVGTNIRELEGQLNRLAAYASLTGKPLSLDLAKEALKDVLAREQKPFTATEIARVVGAKYDVTLSQLKSRSSVRAISFPRQVAMYLLRQLTDMTYPEIAAYFGKHHSSVMYAVETIAKLIENDREFARTIEGLIHILR